MSRRTAATVAALLVLGAGLASLWAWGLRGDAVAVTIVAPGFEPSRAGETGGRWTERGETRSVVLKTRPGEAPGAARVDVVSADGGALLGRLVLDDAAAVLLYHAASRHRALRDELLPNRLARVRSGDEAEGRPALLLGPGVLAEGGPSVGPGVGAEGGPSLRDLDGDRGPRLLAAAASLGAWGVLREGRFVRDGGGRARLPFFRPDAPEWTVLRGSSLAQYLPEADARHVVAEAGFRRAVYADITSLLDIVPEVATRLEALGDAAAPAAERESVGAAADRLREGAELLAAYLDSAWIESIAMLVAPDRLEIELYVHTVVPVELRAFVADLPRRLLLLEKGSVGRLSLRPLPEGPAVAALTRRQQLAFPLHRSLDPVALGPYRFRTTRLDFAIEGLEGSPRLREQLLEALRPLVVDALRGRELAAEHVSRLSAIDDPRYGHDREETPEAFLAALPDRLQREGLSASRRAGTRWDPERRILTIEAGTYDVLDDLLLPPGVALRLAAGVELRVRPGRSILVRGPLGVAGTERQPVRIGPAEAERPWGVLALQGRGGPGIGNDPPTSRIHHLVLEGGSADQLRGATYNGQLSVHHQRLLLAHSTLRGSRADDSLNARYASVAIRDCEFLQSAGDAVDLDWVDGSIERSRFADTGEEGDGLDLSGSQVRVEDSVFETARDKCLSVGERSRLTLRGALLRDCALGVASKDDSEAVVEESVFLDNERDLAAYRKKAVFGGGRIHGRALLLVGARSGAERDAQSEIVVDDSVWLGAEVGDLLAQRGTRHPEGSPEAARLGLDALSAGSSFSAARYRDLRARLP